MSMNENELQRLLDEVAPEAKPDPSHRRQLKLLDVLCDDGVHYGGAHFSPPASRTS